MNNKWSCNLVLRQLPTKMACRLLLTTAFAVLSATLAAAGDAPQWMHALVSAPVPAHDDKTDAVVMYAEENVTVYSPDKIRSTVRRAYKILRPSGRDYGTVELYLDSSEKLNSLHGWCIPAQGRDYEVKDKDSIESAPPNIPGGELISDLKARTLRIPAPDPGNIVGYEYEIEERPLLLQDTWAFQHSIPVRESHYSIQLPSGWEYRTVWLNHPEIKAAPSGSTGWQWAISDVKGIRKEEEMPPMPGVRAQMVVSFLPPGGSVNGFSTWQQMGDWYRNVTSGRRNPSPEIQQKVAALTASSKTQLEKMQVIARFVQDDIRYVAIELGIGGMQPHPASDVFSHHYGDCKDKVTLFSSMLHEVGIDSDYVLINTERGAITPDMPAHRGFDHAIVAVKLPEGVTDSSLVATMQHSKEGRILFFDPTDELTPFGQISGPLQSNYGLLVTPSGGDLLLLPKQPASMNGIRRTGKLTLDASGNLTGEIEEVRLGDRAWSERWALRTVSKDADRIKPIETLLSNSLPNFHIVKASVANLQHTDQPFGFNYSFEVKNYAKNAGTLLLVRPRVLGTKSSGILETKDPRQFPVEFEEALLDTDTFEITLPAGYEVDDLPPPVDADYSFAKYTSKTESQGNTIRYTRSFEIKELSVPVSKTDDLKKFYRIIASDERNTAVLKPSAK